MNRNSRSSIAVILVSFLLLPGCLSDEVSETAEIEDCTTDNSCDTSNTVVEEEEIIFQKDDKKINIEKLEKNGKDGAASSIVGATQKDLEKAGIDNNSDVIDLSQKAKEKGGKLTMEDMMKLHGVK